MAIRNNVKRTDGYILIYNPDHPSADGAGYVPEHRLVLEAKLGRYIDTAIEEPHHLDGDILNNDPSNLVVLSRVEHRRTHSGWVKVDGEWWKTCSRCGVFQKVEGNFYQRKSPNSHNEFVSQCINCLAGKGNYNTKKTHCPTGHPYSSANTHNYTKKDGRKSRRCSQCHREKETERRALT